MILALRLALSLIAGLLVGLLAGGIFVNWRLGAGLNTGDPLILLTGFPGLTAAATSPWREGYLTVAVAALVFLLLAVILMLGSAPR